MAKVTVTNKYAYHGPGVYIGRGSVFGNPYPITKTASRDQVCRQYEVYFQEKMADPNSQIHRKMDDLVAQLKEGQDVVLTCFCKPKRCHGDTIKRYLEEMASGQRTFFEGADSDE